MFHFRKSTLRGPETVKQTTYSKVQQKDQVSDNDGEENQRGGILFRRKRSTEDASKARAQELSARYELSETKDSQLNKKAVHQPGVSLSSGSLWSMKPEQITKMYHEQKNKVDPLLTESERLALGTRSSSFQQPYTTVREDFGKESKYDSIGRSRTWSHSSKSTSATAPISPTGSIETVGHHVINVTPELNIDNFC